MQNCENCRYYAELKQIYTREHDGKRFKGFCMELIPSAIAEDFTSCEQWEQGEYKSSSPLLSCKQCKRFKPFGNGYGECQRQGTNLTVREGDYCSSVEAKPSYNDYYEHKYSGLVDE